MTSINNISAIIYDFDGVILDSVNIKTQAFIKLYEAYGDDAVSYVVSYHEHHGGVSRYKKIAHYHQHLLDIKLSEAEISELADQFSAYVYDLICACSYMPGAYEFVSTCAKHVPQFIASGTPQDELHRICEHRGITQYFKEIGGSPRSKEEIITAQIQRYDLDAATTLMLGDSITDFDAAKACGLPFVQVIGKHQKKLSGVHDTVSNLMLLYRNNILSV